MKVICRECGHKNDLGLVFCRQCSAKLDLSNVTEEIEQVQKADKRRRVFRFMWIPFVLVLLILLGLAAWPYQRPLRKPKAPKGEKRKVTRQLSFLCDLCSGRYGPLSKERSFKENNLNAWFASVGKLAGMRSMSARLKKGKFAFRVISATPRCMIKKRLKIPPIPYSFDLMGKAENGRFKITGAKVGHLPVLGAAARLLTERVVHIFENRKGVQLILEKTTDIRMEDGEITITITVGEPVGK